MKRTIVVISVGLMISAVLALCGCTRKVYVPVENVHTEYRDADTTGISSLLMKVFESRKELESRSDSLIDRSKESVVLNTEGDTIRLTKTQYVYRASAKELALECENSTLRDSIYLLNTRLESIQTDSVPSIVTIERELTKWEKAKMDFGGIAIGGIMVLLIGLVIYIVKRTH